jgi:uncharacterized protein YndB with AHSA1/START domain
MTEPKRFRVEVAVAAPHDAVWRALTEPEEIRRWFGWDYDGLDEEIRFIFVDHATRVGNERIEFAEGEDRQAIELEPDGPRVRVRALRRGPADEDDLRGDRLDEIEEGWRTFLEQLRHQLELHPGEDRRTVRFSGEAVPADVVAAVREALPGETWHASRRQWMLATPEHGEALVVVAAREPVDAGAPGPVSLTLVTYELPDDLFAALREAWEGRWAALARPPDTAA